jgi:hypothetical protein
VALFQGNSLDNFLNVGYTSASESNYSYIQARGIHRDGRNSDEFLEKQES